MPRLEQLLELLKADPADSFLRYGVAMEYAKAARFEEALTEFRELLQRDPNYVPAYFMAGRTCEQNDNLEAAKKFYKDGIAIAQTVGDSHAAVEISQALDAIS